tara:strand:+ start:40 stop:225 length:186 start_codon:yes stop_codon:yes gene_type:complete
MKKGDLVIALEDARRGLHCVGMILDTRSWSERADVYVLWHSPSYPMGWWYADKLRVISEGK